MQPPTSAANFGRPLGTSSPARGEGGLVDGPMHRYQAQRGALYLACYRAARPLLGPHDPKNAEKRRRGASRGGKSKPRRELIDINGRLSALATDVLEGRVDKGDAAVVSQVLNVYLRAVGIELKVKEQEEILARVEELEALIESQKRGGRDAS